MIFENWKTPNDVLREELIKEMEKSDIVFHLTGSRFFREPPITSDIDFFTEDKEETRNFLATIGFIDEKAFGYHGNITDINVAVVYRNLDAKIDVQLIKNIQLKIDIQNWMLQNGKLPPVLIWDKKRQRNWWDEMYRDFLFERASKRKEERNPLIY